MVQVSKDPVGAKGARLTNHVSIPGRYIVYARAAIFQESLGSCRKRTPAAQGDLVDLVGESASVIVRTAAEGASEEELVRDVNRLKAQWEDIERKVGNARTGALRRARPHRTHCPRPLHRRLLRVDHLWQRGDD